MLLSFKLRNYRSFKDLQEFSMLPDEGKNEFPENIAKISDRLSLLRTAVVYGANAAGKSNLVKAFYYFRNLILKGAALYPGDKLSPAYDPFRFSNETREAPVIFEIDFLLNNIPYSYTLSLSEKFILKEELYFEPHARKALLFKRTKDTYTFGDSLRGKKAVVKELTASNQLYLSNAAQNNMPQLTEIFNYFRNLLIPMLPLSAIEKNYFKRIFELLESKESPAFNEKFKALLTGLDTGIKDFRLQRNPDGSLQVFTIHKMLDSKTNTQNNAELTLEEESLGTQRLFVLIGILLRALQKGRTLIIDEFERSLHPRITQYFMELFNNPTTNPHNAQLIIATHNTNFLSRDYKLRRDQIWLTEKRKDISELYALSDIQGIRKGIPYDKWYMSGRFGAIPNISFLEPILKRDM